MNSCPKARGEKLRLQQPTKMELSSRQSQVNMIIYFMKSMYVLVIYAAPLTISWDFPFRAFYLRGDCIFALYLLAWILQWKKES